MYNKIAAVLRNIGNQHCIEKANALEAMAYQTSSLYLRNLDLRTEDIIAISEVLNNESNVNELKSISFSYNKQIGDIGTSVLMKSLPVSICEVGLVDCGIGDQGGIEILQWINSAPDLSMLCIEKNCFSDPLKIQFNAFKSNNPKIMVVF